jgi:predicted nucleic acid-binding protein
MFLLDTNVISALRRPGKAEPPLVQWADSVPASQFYLSVITILELEMGAQQLMRRDAVQGKVIRQWIDNDVMPGFEGRIIPIDAPVAIRCAALHVPDPKSERDAMIAATALVHGLTVATRNVRDFASTGVQLLNPWDGAP